jgi:predicted enzyme related to lactoylglutathione lyase
MLGSTQAFSGFAVDDLDAARAFYGDTLGIAVEEQMGGAILELGLAGGARPVIVYPKPDHEPATFTVLNFPVPDIDATVDALIARGIDLERYDGFEHDERGIAGDGEQSPRIAWFTDPAGNILAVLEDPEA